MRKFAALFGIACLLLTVLTGCHKVSPEQEEISPEESQVQKVQRLSVPGFEKVEVNCPELLQEETSLPTDQILEEISRELSKYGSLTSDKAFSLTGNSTGTQNGVISLLFQGNLSTEEGSSYIGFTIQISLEEEERVSLSEMVNISDGFVSLVRGKALEQAEGALYDTLSQFSDSDWRERLSQTDMSESRDFTSLVGSSTMSILFYLPDSSGEGQVTPIVHLSLEEYQPFSKQADAEKNSQEEQ